MDRLAKACLAGHVALVLFSTVALTTFLAGAHPTWLLDEPAHTVYRWGWRLSGPTYVILGALAILFHAAARFGWARALGLFAVGAGLSLAAELIGTRTGFPFGPYSYSSLLGYRIGGLVPFPIPLSWFYMAYASVFLAGRVLQPPRSAYGRLAWAVAAGGILTAWAIAMDPAMTRATAHWVWHTSGAFYGMPLSNLAGWFLTGSLVAAAMLAVVPARRFAEQVSISPLPAVVYAANGLMPIAICIRHRLLWAALFGAVAMTIPLVFAYRAERRVRSVIFGQ